MKDQEIEAIIAMSQIRQTTSPSGVMTGCSYAERTVPVHSGEVRAVCDAALKARKAARDALSALQSGDAAMAMGILGRVET